MGDNKLSLLLLLIISVLTDAQDNGVPCLLAKRYKSFNKYEYLYEAESLNGLNGALNGPRASCKVEIEVPGTCHYVIRTKECTLSQVTGVDADGKPVFEPAANADTFKAEMEKNPLKVIVEGDNDIKLFPEDDELINILNIKRGIISALAVPVLEEEKNKRMPTVFGLCKTDYMVNTREDIATDVTLRRDLSKCDNFSPIKDHTSPLALITGMHYPLAQLFRSKQTCNYKFDNQQKHMTSGVCTENHLLVPFSHKEKYGVTNVGKQTVSLLGVTEYNERVFDPNEANLKPLHLDASIDMSSNQDENAVIAVLRELAELSQTDGYKRAHLAYKLVAVIRKMNAATLSAALPEAMKISPSLVFQALIQCGTPDCSSAIMESLRSTDIMGSSKSSVEFDAVVYALGMVPNPSRALVKEMLEMAKFKPSKAIYYATSNVVRRLYKAEGKVTPEIQAVAEYVHDEIGNCAGDQDHIYLTLRVIGNMAAAVGDARPALTSAVIQCINQPAASPEVQQAAIQIFRVMPVPKEDRSVLMQVLLDGGAAVQKRIAAYLILMKEPQLTELEELAAALPKEGNLQIKSYIISHITNILSSTAPETKELRKMISDAFQGNEIEMVMDPTKFSRNYKIGSLEGNLIFDEANKLPKEAMLEMTLNAFGYDFDMFEVGVEGKGLEPTVEALFGPSGFFPDTVMKAIYYATDKMPSQVNDVLKNMIPGMRNDRKKRQASQNIVKEITQNVEKLIKDLKAQDAPEAMLYLRLLGAELGYLKTKDIETLAYSVTKVVENFLKMFPTESIKNLFSSTDNELFLHYLFMDNEFYLPTGPGVPLRVALSGTFTPGVKGGLRMSRGMTEFAFMPSAGVEFVTEIGAHLPDYVDSGLEMHTNIYLERGLRATVAVTPNQIKLTMPAPENPIKLISISNSLFSVGGGETKTIPSTPLQEEREYCEVFYPGLKHCGMISYSNAASNDASPYFPLSGDSKFVLDMRPTGEVSEYTATLNYDISDEMDYTFTVLIKAEGTPTEATAKMVFSKETYSVTADLKVTDHLDVGFRIQPDMKTQGTYSITIDSLNNNIVQASLVGLAKFEPMKDAMVQVQLLVPSLQADAKVSASLKNAEDFTLELESDLRFPEVSSVQKLILKYGEEKIEAKIKSDVSSETKNIISKFDTLRAPITALLEQHFGETPKLHEILTALVMGTNNYLEASKIPFVEEFQIPYFPEFEMPEKLFLNIEGGADYHFSKNYYIIGYVFLPFGGKSSKDLNLPAALTTPQLGVPYLGLIIDPITVPLPEILVPETLTLTVPIFGKFEVAGKLTSNFYNLEAIVSADSDFPDPPKYPSYSTTVKVIGTSPVDILSFTAQGSTYVTSSDNTMQAEVTTSINHKLVDASMSIVEQVSTMEMIKIKSSSKLEVISPLNVKISLEHTGQMGFNYEEITGDSNLKGSFVTGPVFGDAVLSQSLALFPSRKDAKIDSLFKVDSTLFQAQNTITASFVNGEISVVSNTHAFGDVLTHTAEITFVEYKFAVKSDAKALALGLKIQNIAEASMATEGFNIKIETTTDNSEDHINSMFIASLDARGLVVNSNASAKLAEHTATHKTSLTLNKNGLATSGTTTLNCLLNFRNTFSGIIDSTKASLSVNTKGKFVGMDLTNDISMSASPSSVALTYKSQYLFAQDLKYTSDISVQAEPYSATVNINNAMKILPVTVNNEAVFKAEPYKVDLTGNLKLAMASEELKHTYQIRYAELTATAKCGTTGKLLGTHMSHDTEVEVAGLGVRINNNANFNSRPVRLTTTLQAAAAPFSFNLKALANGDGEVDFYGKQSAQVYSQVLLKGEPLSLAHSHECRVSTKHELTTDVTIETNFDNKVDMLLTPSEQTATLRVKSKINDMEISKDLSAYNNPERIGLEVSGVVTNTAGSKSQDISLSGFLKYDKNTESHIISLPFIESLPAVLEKIRITVVTMAETLQNYIKTEDFMVKIQTLLQQVGDFMTEQNIEETVVQFKNNLMMIAQECPITLQGLETSIRKLRTFAQKILNELGTRMSKLEEIVKKFIKSQAPDLQKLTEKINALLEEYDIKAMLLALIETIEDVIKQIDIMTLKDSSLALLYDLDELFSIKDTLEQFVSALKDIVANFDKARFGKDIKDFVNIQGQEIADMLKQLIKELDIDGMCKVIYSNVKEILVKYEVGKIIDRIVDLLKQFKIDRTVQVIANTLKSILVPFTNFVEKAINYLKTTEVRDMIEDLNKILDTFIKKMKSFDYNKFVDEANREIRKYTAELNKLIMSLELPQKLEAVREFINSVLSSISTAVEELKSVTVTDAIRTFKNLIDSVALNDIKQIIDDMDLRGEILEALQDFGNFYAEVVSDVSEVFNDLVELCQEVFDDIPFVTELKQEIEGLITALKRAEFSLPSFTVPFTDLVLPSKKFSLNQLQETEFPTKFDIPQFTILGSYTVPATTITYDDIKQWFIELINFFVNFEVDMLFDNTYIGDMTMKYLPDFPAITLPEIAIPDISFPVIPKISDKYSLNIQLQIPEFQLPKIPSEVVIPAFGKLYSEIRLSSPIYTLRTSVELLNSTDNTQMHHFTAFITSVAKSPTFPILNYNLDSTARIGVPKMSRLIIAETLRFVHSAVTAEHQASVTFYGLSAQATAQTKVKATTKPYVADIVNKVFFAVEGGMSASVETSYKHEVNIPFLSLTSEAAFTQAAVATQKDTSIKLTVENEGNGKFNMADFSDEGTHKSDIFFTMNLKEAKLNFKGDTDCASLKMKETLDVEADYLSYIDFKGQIETKSPFIKNSVVVASGKAELKDMKVVMEAKHNAELVGAVSGTLSNSFNIIAHPIQITVDVQNRGNTKVNLQESLSAKIDLQNDYSVFLNTMKQHINTVAQMRFNQHKYNYNFTVGNYKTEAGIYADINGETDLEFLNVPISIPEMDVPVFNFKIPAISEFNLYKDTGLEHLLTSTKQAIGVDSKIVYQKSMFSPIMNIGFITVPAIGKLNSFLSLKSSIFSLNAYAGIHGDDNLVTRIAVRSTSMFESLKAKIEGMSSLNLKREWKLASVLSVDNNHISGNHDSTVTMNMDTMEAKMTTLAKINLPILNIEANHKLLVDNKPNANAQCTMNIKYTFDLPIIEAVGQGDAEHNMKLDARFLSFSVESTTKGMIDGTLLKTGIVKGALDNEANFYMNREVLRSKLKTTGNVNVNHADLKVAFDVDGNLETEASLARAYTLLNFVSNNEVNIAALNTKGKHVANATIDLAPQGSLAANVVFDLSQPGTFGDFSYIEQTIVEMTFSKQNISYTIKMASPVYTTNIAIEVDGDTPIYKVAFKSAAKSPFVLLEHNLDSYMGTAMENDAMNVVAKVSLEHNDFTMDFSNIITASDPSHTVNLDITSPTFTDVSLRYAAQKDGVDASVSTPSAGFLGFQLQNKMPSEMNTRLFVRYVGALQNDEDIFNVRVSAVGDEKINLLAAYNMNAPKAMIVGFKTRMPEVISELSQLSVLFRNAIVQYQKAIQSLINAAVKFLRETQIKLPGMEETTLPEICMKIKRNVAIVLNQIITDISENLSAYLTPYIEGFRTFQVTLLSGEILTGDQIIGTLEKVVEKTEKLIVDTIQFLDAVVLHINRFYTNTVTLVIRLVEDADAFLTIDQLNATFEACMDYILSIINEITNTISSIFPTVSDALLRVQDGKLEFYLPFPFYH